MRLRSTRAAAVATEVASGLRFELAAERASMSSKTLAQLSINRVATKQDCQYSTIGEVKDWIAAYERCLARRAARAARGGVDSETDESDDGL